MRPPLHALGDALQALGEEGELRRVGARAVGAEHDLGDDGGVALVHGGQPVVVGGHVAHAGEERPLRVVLGPAQARIEGVR